MLLVILIFLIFTSPKAIGMEDTIDTEPSHSDPSAFVACRSLAKAAELNNHILPGRILVYSADGENLLDYASAITLGKPGNTETKSVLSCAHVFNTGREHDPKSQFYFCDHRGEVYGIEMIYPFYRHPTIVDPARDVAIYQLSDQIPCNPKVTIAEKKEEEVTLSSISYGWIPDPIGGKLHNFHGINPSYYSRNFSGNPNTYTASFPTKCVARSCLLKEDATPRFIYWNTDPASSQLFLYDSGSPWFTAQEDEYYLYGISSIVTMVRPEDISEVTKQEPVSKFAHSPLSDPMSLDVYQLSRERQVVDTLTALPCLREEIYKYID